MAKKPLLDATSKPRSTFGDFARNYRQSSNVEDRRDGMGMARAAQSAVEEIYANEKKYPRMERDTSRTPSGRATDGSGRTPGKNYNTETVDDYQSMDIGGKVSQTTPSSAYKASPEEAIRKTHIERN